MSTLRPSRPANVWVAALAVGAGLTASTSVASAASAAPGTVTVAVATKDPAAAALRKAKVTVSATRPASAKRTRWTLPVGGTPALGAPSVDLNGRLKFARGKRSVTFTSLRLSVGKKPTISGTVGKRRVTIVTLSGAAKRDAAARTISLKGSRATLNAAAVKVLRSRLATTRVKTGRLGRATVAVRVPAAPVTPPPAHVPAPKPVESAPPAPAPQPQPCWSPTPLGATDWIGCDPVTGGNLRSWIVYLGSGGSVAVSAGATRLSAFDSRLTPGPWTTVPGAPAGRVSSTHGGRFHYTYPSHGNLSVLIENMTFVVSGDRSSADVLVDATYNSFSDPDPEVKVGVKAMTVDLTASRSRTSAAGGTTFELAPASLTAEGRTIWSDFYAVGAPFGVFTITVPDSVG